MYSRRILPVVLVLTLVAASATAARADSHFVSPDQIDWKSLLPAPPGAGSDENKKEIDYMLKLQAKRTPEEAQRCKVEAGFVPMMFSNVMGSWFNPDDLPQTNVFLKNVLADGDALSGTAKNYYKRPRPFNVDQRIQPCIYREKSFSYPSGHSMRGMIIALVLSDMFPDRTQSLIAYGKQIGDDRVLGGVHYPSDVEGGRILAKALFDKMQQNPDFRAKLEQAKEECLAKEPSK